MNYALLFWAAWVAFGFGYTEAVRANMGFRINRFTLPHYLIGVLLGGINAGIRTYIIDGEVRIYFMGYRIK